MTEDEAAFEAYQRALSQRFAADRCRQSERERRMHRYRDQGLIKSPVAQAPEPTELTGDQLDALLVDAFGSLDLTPGGTGQDPFQTISDQPMAPNGNGADPSEIAITEADSLHSQTVFKSDSADANSEVPESQARLIRTPPNPTTIPVISTVSTPTPTTRKLSGNDLHADEGRRVRQAWHVARHTDKTPNVFLTLNITTFPGYKTEKDFQTVSNQAFKILTNFFQEQKLSGNQQPTYIAVAERPDTGGNGYHWHALLRLDPNRIEQHCAALEDRFRKACKISNAAWAACKARNYLPGGLTRLPAHLQTATRPNEARHGLAPHAARVGLSEADAEAMLAYMTKTLAGAVPVSINGRATTLSDHRADPGSRLPTYQASAARPGRRVRVSQNLGPAVAAELGIEAEHEFGWMDSKERARRAGRLAPVPDMPEASPAATDTLPGPGNTTRSTPDPDPRDDKGFRKDVDQDLNDMNYDLDLYYPTKYNYCTEARF